MPARVTFMNFEVSGISQIKFIGYFWRVWHSESNPVFHKWLSIRAWHLKTAVLFKNFFRNCPKYLEYSCPIMWPTSQTRSVSYFNLPPKTWIDIRSIVRYAFVMESTSHPDHGKQVTCHGKWARWINMNNSGRICSSTFRGILACVLWVENAEKAKRLQKLARHT
jgi:hypothetical protein